MDGRSPWPTTDTGAGTTRGTRMRPTGARWFDNGDHGAPAALLSTDVGQATDRRWRLECLQHVFGAIGRASDRVNVALDSFQRKFSARRPIGGQGRVEPAALRFSAAESRD